MATANVSQRELTFDLTLTEQEVKFVLGALVDAHPNEDTTGLETDTVWRALHDAYAEEIGSIIDDFDFTEYVQR